MRTKFLFLKSFLVLSFFSTDLLWAEIKIIELANSTPEEVILALTPHLDKKTKLTSFKNQIIISADAKDINKTLTLIESLDKAEDFYKISFLRTKFPLKKHSYASDAQVYAIQTQANRVAKVNSDFILPLTKINKDGGFSKEFKLFKQGFSLIAKPIKNNQVILNFGYINQTGVSKHKSWNKEELISNIQAPLGFWQLVGETKTGLKKSNSVSYTTKGDGFFYLCVEKLENSQACKLK